MLPVCHSGFEYKGFSADGRVCTARETFRPFQVSGCAARIVYKRVGHWFWGVRIIMADLHIEDFYRDVAKIFVRLYASFPRKMILYVEDICGPDEPDEFGLHNLRFQSCFSAMVWLAEHGHASFYATMREEGLDQVVLTERGFLLLSARSTEPFEETGRAAGISPSVLEDSLMNISQLRMALKDGSSIKLKHCVNYLLSQPPLAR